MCIFFTVSLQHACAALNPIDWKIVKEGYFIEKFPAVLGNDGAGVVEKVGEGVTDFAIGDRV
jgi:NADPH:quinone reductase-like Zn-dependent oxidoreductase